MSHDNAHDEYIGDIPVTLDVATLRRLSQTSSVLTLAHVAWEWSCILLATYFGWQYWNPWLYVPLIIFIGARQHALIILMHEAAHYRLCRSHFLNDWIAECFLAWPFFLFTMRAYRSNHWPHHRHTNGVDDPDWQRKQTEEWKFPKSRWALLKLLTLDLLGIGFVRFLATTQKLPAPSANQPSDHRLFRTLRLVYVATAIVWVALSGAWLPVLLFWIIPFCTWMQFAFHVRSIAEHFALVKRDGVFGKTRTTVPTMLEHFLLVPKNVGYHLEHHLYPSVPFFNLPKLHALLMKQQGFARQAHVTYGYWRVLHECLVERNTWDDLQISNHL